METSYDRLLKVVVVGDAHAGKTSLIKRFVHNDFAWGEPTTIGVDIHRKFVADQDGVLKVQFWDMAGDEKFRPITSSYYRGAHIIVLVLDASGSRSPASRLVAWWRLIKQYAREDTPVRVIINKTDLSRDTTFRAVHEQLKVLDATSEAYACSAKTGHGVTEALQQILYVVPAADITSASHAIALHEPSTGLLSGQCCYA